MSGRAGGVMGCACDGRVCAGTHDPVGRLQADGPRTTPPPTPERPLCWLGVFLYLPFFFLFSFYKLKSIQI